MSRASTPTLLVFAAWALITAVVSCVGLGAASCLLPISMLDRSALPSLPSNEIDRARAQLGETVTIDVRLPADRIGVIKLKLASDWLQPNEVIDLHGELTIDDHRAPFRLTPAAAPTPGLPPWRPDPVWPQPDQPNRYEDTVLIGAIPPTTTGRTARVTLTLAPSEQPFRDITLQVTRSR